MIKRLLMHLWRVLPIPFALRHIVLWLGVQKFLVGVVGVIFNEAGEVLIFRHSYRPDFAWGLPGGWLKAGEDPAVAMGREVEEESGFQVEVLRLLLVVRAKDQRRLDLVFLCRFTGGTFRPSDEVREARFFAPDSLPEMIPAQPPLVALGRDTLQRTTQ